jgi:hypothetical protein
VRRRESHIFTDNRLTDGGEVVSFTHRLRFTPGRKIPDTQFCQTLSQLQGHSAVGRIRSIEILKDLIGNRTHTLVPKTPSCETYNRLARKGIPSVRSSNGSINTDSGGSTSS